MIGDFVFVLFYGGVLVVMGIFSRWMLSREKGPNIDHEIDKTITNKKERM